MRSIKSSGLLLLALAVTACGRHDAPESRVISSVLVSEGISYENEAETAALASALTASGVPYSTGLQNGKTSLKWEAKHSPAVRSIQSQLFGPPLPSGRNLSGDPETQMRFKTWLSENDIPYTLQESHGREFIIWEEKYTPKVQTWEFYPPTQAQAPNPSFQRTPDGAAEVKR